jgi:uncharacterized membrane protein YgcG
MRAWSMRTTVIATVATAGLVATVTTTLAAALDPDGVNLRVQWTNGGHAWLELEDRNVEPAICFVWENDVPQDGDGIASRILSRDGVEVVDLGTGDQWIDGSADGCEIPRDDRYRDVFADPGQYIVEFRVVEEQGTPATPPIRSGPLEPDGGGGSGSGSDSGGSGSGGSGSGGSGSGGSGSSG